MKQKGRGRQQYKEGDWFAVPLREGGFGVGLVARCKKNGIVLGYFFGPKHSECPSIAHTRRLNPQDAVLVRFVGDLGLLEGEWSILGPSENWNRNEWPVPCFVRRDRLTGSNRLIEYTDTLEERSNVPLEPQRVPSFPEDGLSGYGALEKRLTRKLS